MQAVDGGPVKIGVSVDVDARREQLERIYGKPLVVLATFEGDRAIEREIHERFSHLRFGKTEQFRPASELMAFIGRPLLVSQNPDAAEVMEKDSNVDKPLIAVRCTATYKRWAKEFARNELVTPTQLVAIALKRLAEERKFKLPPDR